MLFPKEARHESRSPLPPPEEPYPRRSRARTRIARPPLQPIPVAWHRTIAHLNAIQLQQQSVVVAVPVQVTTFFVYVQKGAPELAATTAHSNARSTPSCNRGATRLGGARSNRPVAPPHRRQALKCLLPYQARSIQNPTHLRGRGYPRPTASPALPTHGTTGCLPIQTRAAPH